MFRNQGLLLIPVLYPKFFWGILAHISTAYLSRTEGPPTIVLGTARKIFRIQSIYTGLKCTYQLGLRSFEKLCSKTFELDVQAAISMQRYENMSGYNTTFSNLLKSYRQHKQLRSFFFFQISSTIKAVNLQPFE